MQLLELSSNKILLNHFKTNVLKRTLKDTRCVIAISFIICVGEMLNGRTQDSESTLALFKLKAQQIEKELRVLLVRSKLFHCTYVKLYSCFFLSP